MDREYIQKLRKAYQKMHEHMKQIEIKKAFPIYRQTQLWEFDNE